MWNPPQHRSPARTRAAAVLAALAFLLAMAMPHRARWQHPSLFADDVVRVGDLRHNSLKQLVFRPINEHVAPLTEGLSWLCWRLAGARLAHAPTTFTAAALASLAAAVALLGYLTRRETGSPAAACAAMALFAGSAVALETFWWYSACTFTWALVFTLASLTLAESASRSHSWTRALAAALTAMAAPACSGIGLLAGPAACLRGFLSHPAPSLQNRLRASLPLLGTAAYLVLVRIGAPSVLDAPAQRWRASPGAVLGASADALVGVLIPELLTGHAPTLPVLFSVLAALGLLLVLFWIARRHPQRGLLAAATLLIVAGYALPYLARVSPGHLAETRQVQRYHLFPMTGLILILAALAAPALKRFDRLPGGAPALGLALLLALSISQHHRREVFGRFYRFPHQPATLAAIERVDQIAKTEGLTTAQAREAIGPLRPNWMPLKEFDVTMLIGPAAPIPRLPDGQAREILLSALRPAEREALAEPVDIASLRAPASAFPTVLGTSRVQPSPDLRVEPDSGAVRFLGPKFLEFTLDAPPENALPTALGLPDGASGALELWWAGEDGQWSPARSLRWRAAASDLPTAVPLDRLPLWHPDRVHRLRVIVRQQGPSTLNPPRLLR